MRDEDFLQDVTLVGDDLSQEEAHKLVLSACSEYFKSIFKQNKHTHPLLCLEGVNSMEIKNLLAYMYNGEVNIFHEDLARFLTVAQRFKLEGLLSYAEEADTINKKCKDLVLKQESLYPINDIPIAQEESDTQDSESQELSLASNNETLKFPMTDREKWNLSMSKQTAINIGPCDSSGSPQKEEPIDFKEANVENDSNETEDTLCQDADDADYAVTKKDEDIGSISHDMDFDSPVRENVEVEVHVNEMDVSTVRQKKRQKTSIVETLNFADDRRYCRSCNMTFLNYKSHYGSKYHQKVVEEQEKFPEIVGPNHDYDPDMTYACEACRFSTNNINIISAHTELNNHKMKITKRDKLVLFCNLCHFSCTRNDTFSQHINTKMHMCSMQAAGIKPNEESVKKSRVSRKKAGLKLFRLRKALFKTPRD